MRHGARFQSPDADLLDAAQRLADLGLIELQQLRTVRCANPQDGDYPPATEHCDGLIDLRPDADEGGGHYRCPFCERIVYPETDRKETFDSLLVHHLQAGIEAFLIAVCGDLTASASFVGGVLIVSLGGVNAFVCIVDYCTDERWYRWNTAVGQPCVYVTVGPDKAPQITEEDAIARVELADLLLGSEDLRALLTDRAARQPTLLANVDVPIHALGARAMILAREDQPRPRRVFHIWLSPAGLVVEGLLAVRAERFRAMGIMRVLLQRFAEAAGAGRLVDSMSAQDLATAVQKVTGGTQDESTIRRTLIRMRSDIADAVRRHSGEPIGEHDIIETSSRSGADENAEGYRLNPMTVALGPFEA